MGQQISADREIQILFNVGSDNEFNVKLELLLQADFDPIQSKEIKEIYKSQQDQFKKLFNLLISKLDSNNPQILKNSLRLITSFLPVMYEPEYKELRDQVLYGTDQKVQVEQKILPQDHNRLTIVKIDEDVEQLDAEKLSHPNYQLLLESLLKLLLKPGFTIAQQLGSFNLEHDPRLKGFLQELFQQKEKLNLALIWRGFATLTKYPNDQKQFIENRITVLSCLIAALGQQLFENQPAQQHIQYLNGIEKNQLEIFVSLWATILFYRHCYFWFQDNFLYQQQQPRNLAVLCSIVIQIIFCDTDETNQLRQIIINNTILPFSVPLLIENISQSYLHDSKILSMNPNINLGYQEFLGLLLYILQHNKHVRTYINQMTEEELRTLISSLIFFISQYLDDKQSFNTYLISIQLIEHLLKFEQVGKFMQKQANLAFPIFQLPLATGTYFDILISFYGQIILKSSTKISKSFIKSFKIKKEEQKNKLRMFKKKLLMNLRTDIISISILRASFYIRDLNDSASEILSQCLHQYFIYEYLFQNPNNSIDFYSLIGASINIIKNGGMKTLYYLQLKAENIMKYKMGEQLIKKFFKGIDDQILKTTNEQFVAEPGLELNPDQIIRYDQFLNKWIDFMDKYLKHPIIDVLKQIITIGLQVRMQNGGSMPTFDQFNVHAQKVTWDFIKDIDFVPETPIKFSWTIFAYSNLLQPLDCLPKFNKEMIQLFNF